MQKCLKEDGALGLKHSADQSVLYSITADILYIDQTLKSIESLRKYNKKILIRLYVFGRISGNVVKKFEQLDVVVFVRPAIKASVYPFLVKWMVLAKIPESRVIMLDSDTYFFGDIEKIFRKYKACKIAARLAPECQLGKNMMNGRKTFRAILPRAIAQYHQVQKTRHFPILNIGVVLFNHDSHKLIKYKKILEKYNWLMSGKLPYPSINKFNRGEFAFALFAATISNFKLKALSEKDVPFFEEIADAQAKPRKPVLCHITYPFYQRFFALEYDRKILGDPLLTSEKPRADFMNRTYILNPSLWITRIGKNTDSVFFMASHAAQLKIGQVSLKSELAKILVLLDGRRSVGEILEFAQQQDSSLRKVKMNLLRKSFLALAQKKYIQVCL